LKADAHQRRLFSILKLNIEIFFRALKLFFKKLFLYQFFFIFPKHRFSLIKNDF